MRLQLGLAIALALFDASIAVADGCKFRRDGRSVPEHEQRALIEWENGTETLYVAALSEPTNEATVWIVPIRARAATVRAEPVEEFPAVVYYETLVAQTRKKLQNAITAVAILNSGGLCCPLFPGMGCGMKQGPASEVLRVEKLGMIVTVVRAGERAALAQYLDQQGINSGAVDLSSLATYFGQDEYCFVCGWVADGEGPSPAASLKVSFPSPNLWFPLRPTSIYTNPVQTAVYVRNFVKPAPGCEVDGLACEYVFGDVQPRGVAQAFGGREQSGFEAPAGRLKPITRVTLTSDARQWDRDLELVPGTTQAGTNVLIVGRWLDAAGWTLSGALGAALGLVIPWATVPRAKRRWYDWIGGALTGAAIVGSIWLSGLVFTIWRNNRFTDDPRRPGRYLALPVLAVAHFGIAYGVCRGLIYWIVGG
jgi:hypothetical protein